jgi:Zn ribbon nucleic-acid-binding protein
MSDQSVSLVPKMSNYPNPELKAQEILEWLIAENIVESALSDCTLNSEGGYRMTNGAEKITNYPNDLHFDLITNGLAIFTKRKVYDAGENGLDAIVCPSCKEDTVDEEWESIAAWSDDKTDTVKCPICSYEADINAFGFSPEFGFSNLGFVFWNIPDLSDEFIALVEQKLDCKVNVVYQHV